jgi:hypothetical protein
MVLAVFAAGARGEDAVSTAATDLSFFEHGTTEETARRSG